MEGVSGWMMIRRRRNLGHAMDEMEDEDDGVILKTRKSWKTVGRW